MSHVEYLKKGTPSSNTAVGVLEHMLFRARAGEITDVVITALEATGGSETYCSSTNEFLRMIGAVSCSLSLMTTQSNRS